MGEEFWEKWIKANEIKKEKLVGMLPLFANGSVKCPFFSVNMINSYFEDLYLYMNKKKTTIFIKKNGKVKKENE